MKRMGIQIDLERLGRFAREVDSVLFIHRNGILHAEKTRSMSLQRARAIQQNEGGLTAQNFLTLKFSEAPMLSSVRSTPRSVKS